MNRKRKPNRGRDGTKSAITDVPVHCSHTAVVPVKKLRPHPRNPNRHPRQQIELLAKIIQGNGWRLPITVSNRSGYIVRGHARLEAARLAGLSHVPVDRQDYADEASELADLVADNKIAELAHLDQAMLGDIARELQDVDGFDAALLGYADAELADLLALPEVSPDIADEFIGLPVERRMEAMSRNIVTVTLTASKDILTEKVRADIRKRYHPLGIHIEEA